MLIPTAVVLTAALAAAGWRCRALRRSLARERVTARLIQGASARDIAALEAHLQQAHDEHAVLAAAAEVVDAAALAHHNSNRPYRRPRGGSDG